MSKAGKRVKSGTAQGGGKWEQALLSTPLEEENWKPNVTFVVGNRSDDYSWIKILGSVIASGPRRLFSVISREQLENEVRELGNPKSKKPKEVPTHYEVCEPCKVHLDNNEDIPLPLLAKLIKFKLLAIKAADVKRREQEKKGKDDKDKGRKTSAKGGKDRAKSPGKGKGGGKKTPEPPSAKEGSKLRKRGEEDDTGKYIDDEPDDGASHYIVVYGYNYPHLFSQLSELGVNVSSIIRISSQDYERFHTEDDVPAIEKDEKAQGKSVRDQAAQKAAEEAEKLAAAKLKKELSAFWKDIYLVLQKQVEGSRLHDIARQEYEVKNLIIPEDLEDQEQKNQFGLAMFEDVACMIYDLIDSRRQYLNYLENLKLLHVPVIGQSVPQTAQGDEKPAVSGAPTPQHQAASAAPSLHPEQLELQPQVDMRYYNDLMNCVPQESCSVPLVLHCMLEQVVATSENLEPPSERVPPVRQDGLNHEVASYISNMAFKLSLTDDEQKIIADVFEVEEKPTAKPSPPLLMNYHDDICVRTHHLKEIHNFNPEKVELGMLRKLPFYAETKIPRPSSSIVRERAARLQELIHFCATGGLTQAEIDRAFKQFVFECMDLTGTDPNGFIMTRDSEGAEHSAIPWDDPYPFFKGMIPRPEKGEGQEEAEAGAGSSERSVTMNVVTWSLSGISDLIDYSLPGTPSPPPNNPEKQEPGKKEQDRVSSGKRQSRPRSKKKSKSPSSPIRGDDSKSKGLDDKSVSYEDNREGSRPSSSGSKKGILRPSSRSSSGGRQSRSNSVHFEKDAEGRPVRHVEEDAEEKDHLELEPEKDTEESLMEVVDAQKRNLDQWCFAEHYNTDVLLQVLRECSFLLPFMDVYYHKRDNSLMLVMHNPHNQEMQCHIDWHTELHSNLGFRNYMEYVAEAVADWTKEEEAKYTATQLSEELVKMREDEEASLKSAEKAARKKSPKKSPSRSKSPKSRGSSQERPSSSNPFVRANSLKAMKEEQDRLRAEEEEKERVKSAKRVKSGKKEKEEKKSPARGSAKSKGSGKDHEAEQSQATEDTSAPEEKYWPFTGYDVGNKLIHVAGRTTTLFPTDGGQIRTERIDFTQGTSFVKTSVLKDGHTFCIHVLDPKEEEEGEKEEDVQESSKAEVEKADMEKSEKDVNGDRETKDGDAGSKHSSSSSQDNKVPSVSAFGSITAQLKDGMTLALSQFGPTGESKDGQRYEPKPYLAPPVTQSPLPPPSPSKSKKGGKDKSAPTPDPQPTTPRESNLAEEDKEQEEKKDEEKPVTQPFQQLYCTAPDGLSIRYSLESSIGMKPLAEDDRRLLVRQSYPYKTKGEQPCESKRKKYALSEASRVITSEGTVVKNMVDGSIEVLYADGTISTHTGPWPTNHSRSNSPQRGGSARSQERAETPTKKGAPSAKSKLSKTAADKPPEEEEEEEVVELGIWVTTYPNGDKVVYKSDGTMEEMKPVMISVASDPQTSQSMATRDDHVITVSYPDGTTIVEHADGTRITTYYKETVAMNGDDQDYESGRDYENPTVKFVKVECPAYATVEFNCSTSENLTIFGNGTTINVFPDGYYMLHLHDGGRVEIDTEGTMVYYPRPNMTMEQLLPERELQYAMCHNADITVETVDSDGNVFNVKNNGDFSVLPVSSETLSESSLEENGRGDKKLATFREHAPRFFIIHADGTGTELLRYQDVAEYLNFAEQSPATAVLKDELPDFPGVEGITILRPYLGGPSEKLFKNYDQDSIIPPGIRCRDLTSLPSKEFKTPGPRFGTTLGQGLSVGAAARQPVRIPIVKCPSVLELRQFIQYKPLSSTLREKMQTGLKEYAEFVTERQKMEDIMKVNDPRTAEERIHAADLLEIGLQSAQNELPQYKPEDIKELYERTTAPPVPSPPPTPQPKRTQADWERDQRELQQEREGLEALKKKKIPTYFDSEFGKAFLLSQTKEVDDVLQRLSEDPRKDGSYGVRRNSSEQSNNAQGASPTMDMPARSIAAVTSVQSDRSSTSPVETVHHKQDTPVSYAVYTETVPSRSGIRPGNPTPAHATGQGSPAPVRPENPTPVHAGKPTMGGGRPVNPTPKMAGGQSESPSDLPSQLDYPAIIMEQPLEEEEELEEEGGEPIGLRSLKYNVIGEPRKSNVPLPRGIKGGKPGAIPNIKYRTTEDPVRRKLNTSLTAGASIKGQTQLNQMRGLQLVPQSVDFGILREGYTYSFTVGMKNTGIDSCRFKLKQPPPATGMRVLYKPGPVAAGMKVDLELTLYAIAVGVEGESGVGSISHELEIVTETDILFLPITATVLTAYEYDNRTANSPKGGRSQGVKLVSTMPPAATGIIRPHRNKAQASSVVPPVR